MVPSDKILPPASILEKLNKIDEQAAEKIITRSVVIGEERRRAELEALETRVNPFNYKSFFKGVASVFYGAADPKTPKDFSTNPAELINKSWLQIGNDIRAALREYCDNHSTLVEKAGLTREEWLSMRDVTSASHAEGRDMNNNPYAAYLIS